MARSQSLLFFRSRGARVLALCWIAGLLCGMELALLGQENLVSLMKGILFCPVSTVWRLALVMIPFLLTGYALLVPDPWIPLTLSFLKACVFSFTACGVVIGYGSAGWLACILLLFGNGVSAVFLYVLWSRFLSGQEVYVWGFLICAVLAVGTCLVDCWIIVPFLAGLIDI